ncbi:TonB-dependent receptor [Novosphingobium sp. NDB2Meth1]|uniref:TonB-dependent receptor n=1 Tax=Novosphingobium sp. NDB2Meth1 TaxID=1892847 RepID=UPI000930D175|nr:TonB-dependent receptor [Novosphingobium sp. NDB2Meth1]
MTLANPLRTGLLAGVCLVAFASTPAFAAAADEQAEAAPAPGVDVPNGVPIEEIVVTATKRETNLQKTPISISVVNAETIRERRVQSLLDLADGGVPSLRVATFEARQSALTIGIRGIVPLDANQPAREQGVGIYIDGVYLGRQHGLNTGLFDIERVEVLKGPQGTLFGRNTEGGALSLVSKGPTGEFGGSIDGSVGNIGSRSGAIHLNLPEVKGFSIKLDGVYQHQDPITKNPLQGQEGWGLFDRKGFRAAVRWKPVDGVTNDFSYDVARDENTPFYSQLLNYNPNNCLSGGSNSAPLAIPAGSTCVTPGTAFVGTQGTVRPLLPGVVVNGDTLMRVADIGVPQRRSFDETHGFTNVLKWKISPEIELRSITAWRGVDVQQWDNSGGAHRVPVVNYRPECTANGPSNCTFSRYSLADLRQRQFSQEIQAVGSIGPVDYVAGLYYFNEHVSDTAATPNSMRVIYNTPTQATYVPNTFCTADTPEFVGQAVNGCPIDRASQVNSKSYAIFGQATWNVNDKLHITAGGRYTWDEKQGQLIYSRNVDYRANPAIAAANGYKPLDEKWRRFNPLVTVAYDVNSEVHAYAKYATGYRAGGASSRTSDYRAFNPEDVKSYEIGVKADLFGRRARLNLAGYIMDRTGSQVDLSTIQPTVLPTGTSNFNNLVTFNAPGTTKIRGIEADLTVKPTSRLTMNVSYAYTYTDIPLVPVTYTQFSSTGTPLFSTTVNQKFYIVYTPRNAASASVDYELPEILGGARPKFHIDANYAQATQSFDQFETKADSSFIVNARLSVLDIKLPAADTKLNIGLWSRNLFNHQFVYRRDPSNSLPAVQTSGPAGTNVVVIGNNGSVLGDYGNFNMPRTFGFDASIKF